MGVGEVPTGYKSKGRHSDRTGRVAPAKRDKRALATAGPVVMWRSGLLPDARVRRRSA